MEKVPSSTEDYRYERKFLISALTKYEIETIVKLHPAIFSEIYHERFVNNLYFDSSNMKNYFDNVDGLKDRVKVRIRWYGDLFGVIERPILELKIKNGLLGRKERFPLMTFSIDKDFRLETIIDVIKKSEISEMLKKILMSLEVTLLNHYRRKYFQSVNRKYRITIDSELEFYQITAHNNFFLNKSVDLVNTVVELKYDSEKDQDVQRVTNYFPFSMNKSSKYVTGLERLYSW